MSLTKRERIVLKSLIKKYDETYKEFGNCFVKGSVVIVKDGMKEKCQRLEKRLSILVDEMTKIAQVR
jgi:chaperonin cofactor prefoldin